ncbi:MAG: DUF6599 family protein [Candidatus Acidiferrales bacterium]
MKIPLTVVGVFFCLVALPAGAQQILPNSFGPWKTVDRAPYVLVTPGVIGGVAVTTSGQQTLATEEYGFVGGEIATYTRGNDSLEVTLYRMKDPTGAFGEYSYLRTPDMPRAKLAEHSSMSAARALILVGNLVVEVHGSDLPSQTANLKTMIAAVAPRAEHGPLPTLSQHLPLTGLIERTDRYVLGPQALNQFAPIAGGDWLGFSAGAEAALANYRLDGHDVTLVVADFPTPQIAAERLKSFQNDLHINSLDADANPKGLYAQRSLTLVGIVAGAKSKEEADKLLSQIQSGTVLTWDEPTWQFTQPGWGPIIVGTIMSTGLICVFALVSGFALGGIRLIVKRVAPGKVFDRPSDMQVLQLGLNSKPINAQDFYGIGKDS